MSHERLLLDHYRYFTDSPSGKIMSYPYDEATGSISFSEGRVFFTCPIEGGVPDGHCVDEMGKPSVKDPKLGFLCSHLGRFRS